jgi:hypothetical protein
MKFSKTLGALALLPTKTLSFTEAATVAVGIGNAMKINEFSKIKSLAITWGAVAMAALCAPAVHAQTMQSLTPAQQEARRKCPLGPYDRCGELVGAYPQRKNKFPPAKRMIGGFNYLIPTEYFQNLDPTGYSNQLTAYWIPLAHFVDGREVAGTLFARESMKYGLMWPYGVRIEIKTNELGTKEKSSTYSGFPCEDFINTKDPYPLKMAFDMTMYRDRSFDNEKKHGRTINVDACFVSDDLSYTFYPKVPVTYWVHPHDITGGSTSSPNEERAEARFTIRSEKVYVQYMFQTALFPYWKEIHRSVLQLLKSWEQ